MKKPSRYLWVSALVGVAGLVWWNGGIVPLLPEDLQYAHVLVLERQWRDTRENPSALERLLLPARRHRTESAYEAFLHRHPRNVPALVGYGNLLADEDRHDEAARQWEAALAVEPASAVAHNNLGQYCLHRGNIAGALQHMDQAIAGDPGGAVYHYNWAMACSSYRQDAREKYGWNTDKIMARSLAAFRKARDLAPEDFTYSSAYAEMFYFIAKPDWAAAHEAWRFCLNYPLSDDDRERTYGRLARICMHLRRFDEAREWLAKMQSETARPFRNGLEHKLAALLDGTADDTQSQQMMRAVSDAP